MLGWCVPPTVTPLSLPDLHWFSVSTLAVHIFIFRMRLGRLRGTYTSYIIVVVIVIGMYHMLFNVGRMKDIHVVSYLDAL